MGRKTMTNEINEFLQQYPFLVTLILLIAGSIALYFMTKGEKQ
jgi:hypothetical protein